MLENFSKADNYHKAEDFVQELERKGDVGAIQKIHQSDLPNAPVATLAIAKRLRSRELITLCRQHPPDSAKWFAAFSYISEHPKNDVMPFLLEMVRIEIPRVRYCCYRACLMNGWSELTQFAKKDVDSTAMAVYSSDFGETLGTMAREYVQRFDLSSASK